MKQKKLKAKQRVDNPINNLKKLRSCIPSRVLQTKPRFEPELHISAIIVSFVKVKKFLFGIMGIRLVRITGKM